MPTPGGVLSYDGAGNETSDGTNTMTWDALNQLVKVTYHPSGATSEFTYDALGRRLKIVVKDASATVTETRQFIWDGMEIAERRDASNAVVRRYFADGYRDVSGSASYYYTKDHLGSIREVTDSAGMVVARYDYDPYGRTTKVSGTVDSDFLYTGHYSHQASGLYLAPYRAYDPNLGRWLSRDPVAENGGINLYGYVLNRPINAMDPFGLDMWSLFRPGSTEDQLQSQHNPPGVNSVAGHGGPGSVSDNRKPPPGVLEPTIEAEALAVEMLKDPRYDPDKPVQLDICDAGQDPAVGNSFAQDLANLINNTVYAPTGEETWHGTLLTHKFTRLTLDPGTSMKVFYPNN